MLLNLIDHSSPQVSSSTGTLQGTPWYRFDDERVYEVEASQALVENFGTGSAGHRRNMWNWQTIKYGRTACMLFYVRRSAAVHILASGAAAAAVQTSINAGSATAAAQASVKAGAAAVTSIASACDDNLNSTFQSNASMKHRSTATSSDKDIWPNDDVPSPASNFDNHHAQPVEIPPDYTDLRKALFQLNRPDALPAFQNYEFDDKSIDHAVHEQHLDFLGLSAQENAQLMASWPLIRGSRNAASSASRSSPIDIKLRSLTISSSAPASHPARSVISPDSSLLPLFSKPSLTMQSITDSVSALCIKKSLERLDSDDENDFESTTTNSLEHLPSYIRAYHPQLLSQLRAFHVSISFCHLTTAFEALCS